MARLENGSKQQLLSEKSKSKLSAPKVTAKKTQRTLTLIWIASLLNVLLWSSIICFAVGLFEVVSDSTDVTSISFEVLTLTSACVTISYTILHTIISLKHRIWFHQRRTPSTIKTTTYVAIRFVVAICVLWLLTTGWNMIIVARRPMCLRVSSPELQSWEFGLRCYVARVGIGFAMLALIASFTLFTMLASVGRPFEAHLFRCREQNLEDSTSNSSGSQESSPAQGSRRRRRGRRMSSSTHQSVRSRFSDTDVETLDLNSSRPPSIHAPVPQRSFGIGVFTSDSAPPPIPVAYATPMRYSSLEPPPPIFHPSMSHQPLTRPPRLSGPNPTPLIPTSIAPQFAASTWRAVHPESLSSMRTVSRSDPHRPGTSFSYRSRYSRSSVSLTRPQRLSTSERAESVGWSSRSGSTGPEGQNSQSSSQKEGEGRASTSDRSESSHGGRISRQSHGSGHKRVSSAPDTTSGAERPRMAMGWKPHAITTDQSRNAQSSASTKLSRSSSAHALSRFSPDSSPDHVPTIPSNLRSPMSPHHPNSANTNTSNSNRVMRELPFRRSRTMDPTQIAEATSHAIPISVAEAAAAMISRMPQDLKSPTRKLHSVPNERRDDGARKGKMGYEEVKNKPLPKIAVL